MTLNPSKKTTYMTQVSFYPQLFISYCSSDSILAKQFSDRLKHSGHSCWLYEKNSMPGISYLSQIEKAMNDSIAVVLLVSKASMRSDQVEKELVRAFEEKKQIFPVLIDIDHQQFQQMKSEWRGALGANVSISMNDHNISSICNLISRSLEIISDATMPIIGQGDKLPNTAHPILDISESPLFSQNLCKSFRALKQKIEALTSEQLRVLNMLKSSKRARISGCAGSGKTLVAVEKALRLDTAGLRVLFLCHSPILAKYVSALLHGSGVEAIDFTRWISRYSSINTDAEPFVWDHNFEPPSAQVDEAFDSISISTDKYDAVIVDEAQDFRPEWWLLVEEALTHADAILYLFHDDRQQLSCTYTPEYPIIDPHVDLSRNIRNSGNVYKVVRYYNRHTPPAERDLFGLGSSIVLDLPYKNISTCLQVALCHVARYYSITSDTIIIFPQGENRDAIRAARDTEFILRGVWQDAVYRSLLQAIRDTFGLDQSIANAWRNQLQQTCQALSDGKKATEKDVKLINNYVKKLPIRRSEPSNVSWRASNFMLHISGDTLTNSDLIGYLGRTNWHEDVPSYQFGHMSPEYYSFLTPGESKGLEADVIVMLVTNKRSYTEAEYYVAISRARHGVFFVTGQDAALPTGLREILQTLDDYSGNRRDTKRKIK